MKSQRTCSRWICGRKLNELSAEDLATTKAEVRLLILKVNESIIFDKIVFCGIMASNNVFCRCIFFREIVRGWQMRNNLDRLEKSFIPNVDLVVY